MKSGISGYLIASFLLHLIIGIILFIGLDFSKPKRPESKGQIVQAVMLDENFLNEQAKQIQQKKSQPKPQKVEKEKENTDLAKRELAQQQERLRITETRRKQAEEATSKAEAEKQKKITEQKQAEEKAQKAEEARKLEEQKTKKAEAESKALALKKKKEQEKKEAEKQAKIATERKRKAAEQAKLQKEMEEMMQQLAAQGEVDKYAALIKATIERYMILDPIMRGKTCTIGVRLASSGFVISVDNGQGDPAVCRSGKAAVLKANQLPVPKDPAAFDMLKKFNLKLEPSI